MRGGAREQGWILIQGPGSRGEGAYYKQLLVVFFSSLSTQVLTPEEKRKAQAGSGRGQVLQLCT